MKEKKTKISTGTNNGSTGSEKTYPVKKHSGAGPTSRTGGGGKSTGSRGNVSGGGNYGDVKYDEVEVVGEGFEECLKGKEVEVQSFDRKYFQTELARIPYEQIERYQHGIPSMRGTRTLSWRNTGVWVRDVRGGKLAVTVHPDNGNLEDVLEVIDDRNLFLEEVSAIIVDGHHRLAVLGGICKATVEQYN